MADVARRALTGSRSYSTDLVLLAPADGRWSRSSKVVQQILRRVPSAQQHRRVQLAPAVDADVEDVLRVELEVQPRAAVGNDAGAVEQLARGVRLALVVIVEDARRAVELARRRRARSR